MSYKWAVPLAAFAVLAACTPDTPSRSALDTIKEIAAPGQNLSSVRIDEKTGCYTYLHDGPVEVTYLPLRAKNGRPICRAS